MIHCTWYNFILISEYHLEEKGSFYNQRGRTCLADRIAVPSQSSGTLLLPTSPLRARRECTVPAYLTQAEHERRDFRLGFVLKFKININIWYSCASHLCDVDINTKLCYCCSFCYFCFHPSCCVMSCYCYLNCTKQPKNKR